MRRRIRNQNDDMYRLRRRRNPENNVSDTETLNLPIALAPNDWVQTLLDTTTLD